MDPKPKELRRTRQGFVQRFAQLLHFGASCIALLALLGQPALSEEPISTAERRLFVDDHLKSVPGSATLRYNFSKTGSYEQNFDDKVLLSVKLNGNSKSCHVEFLSGNRKFVLPEVEAATGNPVVLSFLERDIREMHRITTGPANHFRRQVRLALANEAEVKPITFQFEGEDYKGQQITITPYEDDPMRPRFERFSNKTYVIRLSDQIPGTIDRKSVV